MTRSVEGTKANDSREPQPAKTESEIEYFERVVREAEDDKVKRFWDWHRDQLLRGRS